MYIYCASWGLVYLLRSNAGERTKNKINIYYKQPSFIHNVDYKHIVKELWDAVFGEFAKHDKYIKTIIACINIALGKNCMCQH